MLIVFYLSLGLSDSDLDRISTFFKEGQFKSVISVADSAINKQGLIDANPLLFFYRGQAYYQIGKFDQSIQDLSRCISSGHIPDKDLNSAFVFRGKSRLRLGYLDDAESDAGKSKDRDLMKLVRESKTLFANAESKVKRDKYEDALNDYKILLKTCISSVDILIKAASIALQIGNIEEYSDLSHQAMQIAPKNAQLLLMRGMFFLCDQELELASRHFKLCASVSTDPSKCNILLRASNQFLTFYNQALNDTKSQKYDLAQESIDRCHSIAEKHCKQSTRLTSTVKLLKIKLMISRGKKREAMSFLDELLKESPNSTELLLERADIYIEEGDFDSANNDYQTVRRIDKNNQRAENGLERISKEREKEKNIDYYEVLGLKKGASLSEIKEAYKLMVRKWHPDRYGDPIKKREAEKKMKQINRSYDILGDPEKKKMYDSGIDPENPQQGGPGQQGHPGGFGFNPFDFFRGGNGGFGGFGGQNVRYEFHFG